MVPPDHDRRLDLPAPDELVDRESCLRAVAEPEPADPGGQSLECHPLGGQVEPPLQKRIVGEDRVDALYANAPQDEQHIQRFLSANCFGDHLTRSGIDVPTRELLTFAMLASLGGCEPQLAGHVGANVNVGNDRARLLAVLTQLIPYIGYPRTLNALRVLDQVTLA